MLKPSVIRSNLRSLAARTTFSSCIHKATFIQRICVSCRVRCEKHSSLEDLSRGCSTTHLSTTEWQGVLKNNQQTQLHFRWDGSQIISLSCAMPGISCSPCIIPLSRRGLNFPFLSLPSFSPPPPSREATVDRTTTFFSSGPAKCN